MEWNFVDQIMYKLHSSFRDLLLTWGGRCPDCDCPPCRGRSSWSSGRRSSWQCTPWPAPLRHGEGSRPESGGRSSRRPWGRDSVDARRESFWAGLICKSKVLVINFILAVICSWWNWNIRRFPENIIEKFQFTLVQFREIVTDLVKINLLVLFTLRGQGSSSWRI